MFYEILWIEIQTEILPQKLYDYFIAPIKFTDSVSLSPMVNLQTSKLFIKALKYMATYPGNRIALNSTVAVSCCSSK